MRLTPLERARENYAYLTEVAEFWGTRDHECTTVLGFLCSACHEFYADIEAASIALDLAVAEAHPSPLNLVDYIGRPHAGVAY